MIRKIFGFLLAAAFLAGAAFSFIAGSAQAERTGDDDGGIDPADFIDLGDDGDDGGAD